MKCLNTLLILFSVAFFYSCSGSNGGWDQRPERNCLKTGKETYSQPMLIGKVMTVQQRTRSVCLEWDEELYITHFDQESKYRTVYKLVEVGGGEEND